MRKIVLTRDQRYYSKGAIFTFTTWYGTSLDCVLARGFDGMYLLLFEGDWEWFEEKDVTQEEIKKCL